VARGFDESRRGRICLAGRGGMAGKAEAPLRGPGSSRPENPRAPCRRPRSHLRGTSSSSSSSPSSHLRERRRRFRSPRAAGSTRSAPVSIPAERVDSGGRAQLGWPPGGGRGGFLRQERASRPSHQAVNNAPSSARTGASLPASSSARRVVEGPAAGRFPRPAPCPGPHLRAGRARLPRCRRVSASATRAGRSFSEERISSFDGFLHGCSTRGAASPSCRGRGRSRPNREQRFPSITAKYGEDLFPGGSGRGRRGAEIRQAGARDPRLGNALVVEVLRDPRRGKKGHPAPQG